MLLCTGLPRRHAKGVTPRNGAFILIAASNCPTAAVPFDIVPNTEGRTIWDAHTGCPLSQDALGAQTLRPGEGRIYIVGTPAERQVLMQCITP